MSRRNKPTKQTKPQPPLAVPLVAPEAPRSQEARNSELDQLQVDRAKIDLEKARADLAIAKWNSSAWGWTGPTKLTDLITPIVAVGAAFVALYSGHLNAVLERTRVETTLLTIEKGKLQNETARLERDLQPIKVEYDTISRLSSIAKDQLIVRFTKDLRYNRGELVIASGRGFGVEAEPVPTIEALAQVKNLRDLMSIELNQLPITDASLAGVDDRITVLRLPNCSLKGELTSLLERFGELRHLDLRSFNTPVVTHKPFPQIRRLDLAYSSVISKDLPALVKSYPNVAQLDLSGTSISDEGIETLTSLPKLRWLLCRNTHLTKDGIRKLKKCPKLYSVSTDDPRIVEGFLDNGEIMITHSEDKEMNPWLRGTIYDDKVLPPLSEPPTITP